MEITFLGTGAATPTNERGVSGIHIRQAGTNVLLDCGEGTVRQMGLLGRAAIDALCITHEHTDHIGGVNGLLRDLAMQRRTDPLPVYATAGCIGRLRRVVEAFGEDLTFSIEWNVIVPGQEWKVGDLVFSAFGTTHNCDSTGFRITAPAAKRNIDLGRCLELGIPKGPLLGRLQKGESVTLPTGRVVMPDEVLKAEEPGEQLAYTGDTRPSAEVTEGVRGVDTMVMDCTYWKDDMVRAIKNFHSTADEVGETARDAGVGRVVLTHISAKYSAQELEQMVSEVRTALGGHECEVVLAQDGLSVQVVRHRTHEDVPVASTVRK